MKRILSRLSCAAACLIVASAAFALPAGALTSGSYTNPYTGDRVDASWPSGNTYYVANYRNGGAGLCTVVYNDITPFAFNCVDNNTVYSSYTSTGYNQVGIFLCYGYYVYGNWSWMDGSPYTSCLAAFWLTNS